MAQKVLFLAAKDIYQNLSQVISRTCLFVVPVALQPLGALSNAEFMETICVCVISLWSMFPDGILLTEKDLDAFSGKLLSSWIGV